MIIAIFGKVILLSKKGARFPWIFYFLPPRMSLL